MRSLLADELRACITNRDGSVDEVGADEHIGRVKAMGLPSAQFALEITQTVAPRANMVIAMVEIKAARGGRTLHDQRRTACSCGTAWPLSGGWSRRCPRKATRSGLRKSTPKAVSRGGPGRIAADPGPSRVRCAAALQLHDRQVVERRPAT
jgi:hypothetical protein